MTNSKFLIEHRRRRPFQIPHSKFHIRQSASPTIPHSSFHIPNFELSQSVAHSPQSAAVSGLHPLLQSSALACDEARRQLFPLTRCATHLDADARRVPDEGESRSRAVRSSRRPVSRARRRISPRRPENFSAPSGDCLRSVRNRLRPRAFFIFVHTFTLF